jgi:copper(I)-binding protein
VILRSLAATMLLAATLSAQAADAGPVTATAGWLRVLPGNLPAGGYVTFENASDKAVSIVGAESSDYAEAMIHRSSTEGGMGRMEMMHAVPLPAGGKLAFAPGGYHVMLMDAKHPVKPGDKVVVTFALSDGQKLPVTLLARPANASGPAD